MTIIKYEKFIKHYYSLGYHIAVVHSKLSISYIVVLEKYVQRGRKIIENTDDYGKIYAGNNIPVSQKSWGQITINESWVKEVKFLSFNKKFHTLINNAPKSYQGLSLNTNVETTATFSVEGIIITCSPEPK
jgi:hypothetical protein